MTSTEITRDRWSFDDDGDTVAGKCIRAGKGFTKNGEQAFVVLDVDGTERTVWLHHRVLKSCFAREVARRDDNQIHVGELVEIQRLDRRDSGENPGRDYV